MAREPRAPARAVRVLHLDDSPVDAELVRERILADGGGTWDFTPVLTGAEFERALATNRFDLILTDYNIPGYDGLLAVERAHHLQPDAPIIVISGAVSEEDAVTALRAGATDYVFKQRLQRLAPAARRALEEAAERRRRRLAEAAVRNLSERLGELARNGSDVVWVLGLDPERLFFVSPSVERVWGLPPQAFYDDPRAWLKAIHEEDRPRVEQSLERSIASHDSHFDVVYRVVRPDGSVRWVHDTGTVLHDAQGRVDHLSGIARDVTETRRAEEEIRRLNADLERKVEERTQELEAFSYSVSHDLRAPLHAVSGFADALAEDYLAKLDERGRHYLDRIRRSATRMDGLIEDLLSLSQLSRTELLSGPVDMTALAESVVGELREQDPHRQVRVAVAGGMRAHGDERLLRIAMTNLLGNAWKFSARKEDALIEVGHRPGDGPLDVFFVRDNGAGFDPMQADRLFGAFQRLHSQSEFPGTGIGLATVRRVIERHCGRVWATSTPGEGATFLFSLPRAGAPR